MTRAVTRLEHASVLRQWENETWIKLRVLGGLWRLFGWQNFKNMKILGNRGMGYLGNFAVLQTVSRLGRHPQAGRQRCSGRRRWALQFRSRGGTVGAGRDVFRRFGGPVPQETLVLPIFPNLLLSNSWGELLLTSFRFVYFLMWQQSLQQTYCGCEVTLQQWTAAFL
jgi:hypothetical protein